MSGPLKNVGVLLLGVVAGFIVTEIAVRVYLAVTPASTEKSVYISDPNAEFRLRPTPVEERGDDFINSFGFRDREHTVEKPAGSFRMIGIGDSFVYGAVPVAENFLRIAEHEIARVTGDSIQAEMLLMGVGGYSPENYVGILKSLGLSVTPDLAVLNIFVGNDIHLTPVRGRLMAGRLFYVGSPNRVLHLLRQSRAFLLAESFFLTKVKAILLKRKFQGEKQGDPSVGEAVSTGGVEDETYVFTEGYVHVQKKRLPVFKREAGRQIAARWEEAEGYILDFEKICAEAKVPWILVVIPTEIQVDKRTRGRILEVLDLSEDMYDFDLPQKRLSEFAKKNDLMMLDLLHPMRALHEDTNRLYVPNNTHWNTRGNRIAGELLARFIMENIGVGRMGSNGRTAATD